MLFTGKKKHLLKCVIKNFVAFSELLSSRRRESKYCRKMFGRSTASFDRLLEKATSQLLLEPDWASIMMICDSIRQGDTNAK